MFIKATKTSAPTHTYLHCDSRLTHNSSSVLYDHLSLLVVGSLSKHTQVNNNNNDVDPNGGNMHDWGTIVPSYTGLVPEPV